MDSRSFKKSAPFIGALIGALYAFMQANGKHVAGYAVVGAIVAQVVVEVFVWAKKTRA